MIFHLTHFMVEMNCKACQDQAGICFTIVKFVTTDQVFLMPADILFDYWDAQATGRKSIPKAVIERDGFEIDYALRPRIPYLNYVDLLLEK